MNSMTSEAVPIPGNPTNDGSLSELAYQAIMGMLLRGELVPNQIVTERQIAARLGMSRTPLREATRRLEGERFLERHPSGTLIVRPLPVDEFVHILGVRRVLEAEAARLATGHIGRDELQRIRDRVVELRGLPEDQPPPPALADVGRDLHLQIAAASGNPILQLLIEDLRKRTAMVRLGRMPARRVAVCSEHLAIIDAMGAGNADKAAHAMQQHVDRVRATILERLRGR
ncbi:MAG: GntR family transcriptional regulator [Burkholderiaceae bacterium]|jgi:DNA-binding GntR family transcriptional regulator